MLHVLQLYNLAVRAASWRIGPDQISGQEVEGFSGLPPLPVPALNLIDCNL
jgi:hypothetical protein